MAPQRPWNRQPGESAPAYEAFAFYRDIDGQSIRLVADLLCKQPSLLFRWSARHHWGARVDAWTRFHARELGWDEPQSFGDPAGDLSTVRRVASKAARELERRMEEDPAFLQGLSPEELRRIVNLETKVAPAPRKRATDESSPSVPEQVVPPSSEEREYRRERCENFTLLYLHGDPSKVEQRSGQHHMESDDGLDRMLKWYSLEKAELHSGFRELGFVIRAGPPADWNARLATLARVGTLDRLVRDLTGMRQSELEDPVPLD